MPTVSAKLAKATVKAPNALLVTVPYLKVVEPDLVPRRGEPYSNSSLIVESVVERCVVGKPGCPGLGAQRGRSAGLGLTVRGKRMQQGQVTC